MSNMYGDGVLFCLNTMETNHFSSHLTLCSVSVSFSFQQMKLRIQNVTLFDEFKGDTSNDK